MLKLMFRSGFGSGGFIIAIVIIIAGGAYLWRDKLIPSTDCEATITVYNRIDGTSIPQRVTLGGVSYEINSHIETEDKWASFTLNGGLDASVINPLAVARSGMPFRDSAIIKGVIVKVLKIGYTADQREFAEVCLSLSLAKRVALD